MANDHFGAKMKREALPDHSNVYFSKKFNMTILNPNPQNTKYKRDKKDNFGHTKQKLSEIEKWETAILTVRRKVVWTIKRCLGVQCREKLVLNGVASGYIRLPLIEFVAESVKLSVLHSISSRTGCFSYSSPCLSRVNSI